ncbi:MAG: tetratricopeptide domain-containing protein [Chlorobi bacterium OLB5]|nr:MAG: tetratricopeptide domain-containing protein [Chlorobi bacterium OLB5]
MRSVKVLSVFLIFAAVITFLTGCNSAEQTTAKLAYQQGDYKKAESEFLKETNQNPTNEEAWFYLAMSRAQLGNAAGVLEAMDKYRALGKNSFRQELTEAWGTMYDRGYKQYEDGEKIAKTGKDEDAVKKFQESLNNFEIALALLPDSSFVKDNVAALNNRVNTILVKPVIDKGVELEKNGDFAGAIAEYNKGLQKVSKGSGAYEVIIYNISLANLKWGEKMREANSEDPAYKEKYQAALPYLEELTGSKDKDNKLNAYELLIQVYANLGMNDKAQDAIKMRDQLKDNK